MEDHVDGADSADDRREIMALTLDEIIQGIPAVIPVQPDIPIGLSGEGTTPTPKPTPKPTPTPTPTPTPAPTGDSLLDLQIGMETAYAQDPSAYYITYGQTKVPWRPNLGGTGFGGFPDLSQYPGGAAALQAAIAGGMSQTYSPALAEYMNKLRELRGEQQIVPAPAPAGDMEQPPPAKDVFPEMKVIDKTPDQQKQLDDAARNADAESQIFIESVTQPGEGPAANEVAKLLKEIAPSILKRASQGELGATERNQLLQAELAIIEKMRELQEGSGMASLAMLQMGQSGDDIPPALAQTSIEETGGASPQDWFEENEKVLLTAFQNQAQLKSLSDKLTALKNFRARAIALNEQQIAAQPFVQGQALVGLLRQLFPGQEFPGLAGPDALGRSTVGSLIPFLFEQAGTRQQQMLEEQNRAEAKTFLESTFPNMPGAGALAAFPSLVPQLFERQEARRQTGVFEERRKPLAAALTGLFPGMEGVGAFAAAPELVPQLFERRQQTQQQQALAALTQQIAPGLGPQAAQAGGYMPDLLSMLLKQALQGGIQQAPLTTTFR